MTWNQDPKDISHGTKQGIKKKKPAPAWDLVASAKDALGLVTSSYDTQPDENSQDMAATSYGTKQGLKKKKIATAWDLAASAKDALGLVRSSYDTQFDEIGKAEQALNPILQARAGEALAAGGLRGGRESLGGALQGSLAAGVQEAAQRSAMGMQRAELEASKTEDIIAAEQAGSQQELAALELEQKEGTQFEDYSNQLAAANKDINDNLGPFMHFYGDDEQGAYDMIMSQIYPKYDDPQVQAAIKKRAEAILNKTEDIGEW